jgi:uncharacterized protein YjbJ (UPF0337 family)
MPRQSRKAVPVELRNAARPGLPADPAERRWVQMQRELKYWWGELTDEDVLRVAGRRDKLLMVLNERYGYSTARAGREIEKALSGKRPR